MITDPVADMLTRLRNAYRGRKVKVEMPTSRLKLEILRVLKDEGYIQNYKHVPDPAPGVIRVFLRSPNEGIVNGLQRISRPGCRIYCSKDDIPRVEGGLGINILSTSKGVMTGRQAGRVGVGGEILCNVW